MSPPLVNGEGIKISYKQYYNNNDDDDNSSSNNNNNNNGNNVIYLYKLTDIIIH